MHIGIDASRAVSKKWGGPENYSYYLIRALSRIDKKNKYTLYVNDPPPRKLIESDNFTVTYIPLPRLWTQLGLALESFFSSIDILFIPAHTIPFIRRPRLKTVVTIHDLAAEYLGQYYKFPGRLYLNKLTEYCARHATRVIAVSQSTKKDLISLLGVEEERIRVIYEGYDCNLFKVVSERETERIEKKYNIRRPYVLSVGTIQPRKNLVRLIEAFSKLSGNTGSQYSQSNLQLILVGKRGWLCDDIYAAPKKYGVEESVFFLGHVPDEDLPGLMSGAEVFAYPSLYEGFGLVVLEAMACGTPVITSNISSLPEAANDAAILVNPYNIDEMAQALKKILSDAGLRETLVRRGFSWVKRFSWEKTARETLTVFEEVYSC